MNLGKRLYTRVGYDDINETFWNKASVEKMLTMEAMGNASSGYAKYRQFLRSAGAATERDQRLAAVFQKTFREHYGWGMVFCTFHRMFTFLSIALHLLVVHAFTGARRSSLPPPSPLPSASSSGRYTPSSSTGTRCSGAVA